ncbi:PAS modulated sigma54 specific transcriptional regulator, Fis family [Desulfobulbus propionicus DSM 2032]|uniref:PAS modulated sigma54 specific transcriptional regulator, Fis family n=1 Tax=Desulfobulbus propionicus (strain ATCC 33891 / DSM 2032 / VKM B-1956 / 1pr3) TaxID=577650 RepID=A0A7U3YKX3_DESPD|nr:sigma-54-dependent Fis family transcriptional regulator [Desulfobulbus propionicus]ADW17286.1 PAS modulated sigma54 specific transcriptional regulator, Fis family [Desulfobulbus propionicus DSM 2032]
MAKQKKTRPPDGVTDIILESISDGVFTVNHEWRIMSFNRAAEEITGVPREEAIGRYCWEVFRSNMCEGDCALRKTMKEGRSFVSSSTYIINSDKKRIPISVSTAPLKSESGEILGGVETFRDNTVVEELRRELSATFRQGDMVSRSRAMKKIFAVLPQIAESDSTVLIEGETGTGKEIMARSLHDLSTRRDKPFVAINCGALPDTLLESELFGYKAGAFTNAAHDKPGYFSLADGGTILLDELGETSPAFQVKLLRVLEEREFQALGSIKKERVNVRILAATNRNLEALVEQGSFRRDLFYRINIVRLPLPPLRERKEDIPLLIERFIDKMNRLRGKMLSGIEPAALERLMAHEYPGNIRELENIIEHAFILCSQGPIGLHHLPAYLHATPLSTSAPAPVTAPPSASMSALHRATEREAILEALERNNYNRLAAARELGMHKSTLFRKVKKLQLDLPEIDGRHSGAKTSRVA